MTVPTMTNLAEASKRTGLSYAYLRQLCLQNKIVYVRSGKRYFINLEKLIEYLNKGDPCATSHRSKEVMNGQRRR